MIYVDESVNPYGTWKDRRSQYIIQKAKEEGVHKLCLITAGNGGYSLAQYAKPEGIQVVSVVDTNLNFSVKEKLKEVCASVIEVDLSHKILKPEEVVALSRENDDEVIWDVTNGFPNAYESIVEEIKDKDFDYLLCPVGGGEAFVGLYLGLKKNNLNAKLIGVGVSEYPSFADKLATLWTPYKDKIEEILQEGHQLIRLNDDEVRKGYSIYKDIYSIEPSSSVVWIALEKFSTKNHKIAVINSGKGIF